MWLNCRKQVRGIYIRLSKWQKDQKWHVIMVWSFKNNLKKSSSCRINLWLKNEKSAENVKNLVKAISMHAEHCLLIRVIGNLNSVKKNVQLDKYNELFPEQIQPLNQYEL